MSNQRKPQLQWLEDFIDAWMAFMGQVLVSSCGMLWRSAGKMAAPPPPDPDKPADVVLYSPEQYHALVEAAMSRELLNVDPVPEHERPALPRAQDSQGPRDLAGPRARADLGRLITHTLPTSPLLPLPAVCPYRILVHDALPDQIINVTAYPLEPSTRRPIPSPVPLNKPRTEILSNPRSPFGGQQQSIADLIGQIEVTPDDEEEIPGGSLVDVTIVYPPEEHSGGSIFQQQMRAYHWKCFGVSDTEIIRKTTEAWSSHMNRKVHERSLRLGDVIIIEGRHYIIDRIGPQSVSYEIAETWVRLESYQRSRGFEIARKSGYI